MISLSHTISGLHWNKIPGDNDDEVGARGILYLLIFQQLGQLLRWTWGYNVLLKPADQYTEEEGGTLETERLESGYPRYTDDSDDEANQHREPPRGAIYDGTMDEDDHSHQSQETPGTDYDSGGQTPITYRHSTSVHSSRSGSQTRPLKKHTEPLQPPTNGNMLPRQNGHLTSFPTVESRDDSKAGSGFRDLLRDWSERVRSPMAKFYNRFQVKMKSSFKRLPSPIQTALTKIYIVLARFSAGVYEFMNPPLWAMLVAIIIASIPRLQHLFFDDGTFIRNSVTRAIEQSGGVAVPLILVVLGANLARNTLPADAGQGVESKAEERNLLIAALVSRMLLPTIIMAPILALIAKYIPVSIVDDKIFIIVCFLLTGAPSALQLAQICQVNNVYMGVMSKLLFQSYVVWILPSTLILVLCALEVVEWAER